MALPVVTWPAAMAAFHSVMRMSLREPDGDYRDLRRVFLAELRYHFRRSLVMVLVDVLVLCIMLFAVAFWLTQPLAAARMLAGVAIPFLLVWWICQPFLYPVLVEYPEASVRDVFRQAVLVAFMHPLYALSLTIVVDTGFVVGLLLLGPALLVLGPFAALLSIQGFWVLTGTTIPDLVDPVGYADRPER
jgi:uncharacterized membrane protein YesL